MRVLSSYKGNESGRVPSDFSTLTGPKPNKTLVTIAYPLTFRANPSPTAFFYHKINLSSLRLTFLPKGTIIGEKKTLGNKAIKQMHTGNLTRKEKLQIKKTEANEATYKQQQENISDSKKL